MEPTPEETSAPLLLIRSDASQQMGTGHVMRCLALTHAWLRRGGRIHWAYADMPAGLLARLHRTGVSNEQVKTPADTVRLAQRLQASWVVLDGYRFGSSFQEDLKNQGLRVLFIDDYGHADRYVSDLVLNQNLYARRDLYPTAGGETRFLLGPRYALLRPEFGVSAQRMREVESTAVHLLVTLGGADQQDIARSLLDALPEQGIQDLSVTVVTGSAGPAADELLEWARRRKARVLSSVEDMAQVMAQADLALTAGGTTCLELACMGVPMLVLVLADNQVRVAEAIEKEGLGLNMGRPAKLSQEALRAAIERLCRDASLRREMGLRGRQAVDGCGAERVIFEMRSELIHLRPATSDDAGRLWEWASDLHTRAMSYHPNTITWEEHQAWFSAQKSRPSTRLWIGEDEGGVALGQVRFDVEGLEATISVSVAPDRRGAGHGTLMIARACRKLQAEDGVRRVHAYIKVENRASVRAFNRAGFSTQNAVVREGQASEHLLWEER